MKKIILLIVLFVLVIGIFQLIKKTFRVKPNKSIFTITSNIPPQTNKSVQDIKPVSTGPTTTPVVPVISPIIAVPPSPVNPPINNSAASKSVNVSYKTVSGIDPNALSLDIYFPAGYNHTSSPYPVMVWVHGGGYHVGDKSKQMTYKPSYFNSLGYVFVSVNYRLTPTARYPDNHQDVADAIAFILENKVTYNIDTNKVSVIGHSAGAQIVSVLSTNSIFMTKAGYGLNSLRCAVSLDHEGYDISDDMSKKAYQAEFPNTTQTLIDASPIKNISSTTVTPPFLIVTRGTKGRVKESVAFSDALLSAGHYSKIIETQEYEHEEVNDAIGNPDDKSITPILTSFLQARCL